MAQDADDRNGRSTISRRGLITAMGAAGAAALLAPGLARAKLRRRGRWRHPARSPRRRATSGRTRRRTCTSPTPTSSPSARVQRPAPARRPHPAALDRRTLVGGPAWNSQGRYLLWSDIPNNRRLRWLEDNGKVSVFRTPSNNSNGNTFDFQGRQLSCEHLTRRVVRYENRRLSHYR